MRSMLNGAPLLVGAGLLAVVCSPQSSASAQQQAGPAPAAAVSAIAANRTAEARVLQQNASAREAARDRRATYMLEAAQSFLFDGRYADAVAAFAAVLESDDARGIDTLTAWAHHGMAVAEAFAGHPAAARAHYDAMLRVSGPTSLPLAIADSIEAAVLTHRFAAATALLDRFSETHHSLLAEQYAHSFRALEWLVEGNCTAAAAALAEAPASDRPLPQAVRGACAAKAGRHAEAIALRDSVLTHPLADPLSWPMIIARGVALGVH